MNSRLCQHHGQSVLLDPGGSVKTHVVNSLQQLGLPVILQKGQSHLFKATLCLFNRKMLYFCLFVLNSQSQLLKRFHGEQWRVGVPLQDLHLAPAPHQSAADQLVQQGLLRQVHGVLTPAVPLILLQHHVA